MLLTFPCPSPSVSFAPMCRAILQNFEIDMSLDPLLQSLDQDQNGIVDFEEFAYFLRVDDHEIESAIHQEGSRSASLSCFSLIITLT